jgi:hypothetical protein
LLLLFHFNFLFEFISPAEKSLVRHYPKNKIGDWILYQNLNDHRGIKRASSKGRP